MKVVFFRCIPWQLLSLASVAAAAGKSQHPQAVLSDISEMRSSSLQEAASVDASIDARGNFVPASKSRRLLHHDSGSMKAARVDDGSAVVRREEEVPSWEAVDPIPKGDSHKDQEVLLEMKATSGSVKIVLLFLFVSVAMITFCAGAIYLVWQPLAAMFEERAFEQAAKKALVNAAPPPPPAPAQSAGTEDDMASAEGSSARRSQLVGGEVRLERRVEKLSIAWSTFMEDPVLQIQSSNVLFVAMQEMFDKTQSKQFDDLFDEAHAANPEGAPLTDIDHLTKQDMERILDSINGSVSGMAVTGSRINTVRPKAGAHCVFAVANSAEDYDWLFDSWDTVFPEQEPLTKDCFPGILKLVLAWNFVRTLHTARHMTAERSPSGLSSTSGKPAMEFKIDLRTGKAAVEVRAEVEFDEEVPPQFQGADPTPEPQGDTAPQATTETMQEKLARKSKTVEEVTMEDGENSDDDLAP